NTRKHTRRFLVGLVGAAVFTFSGSVFASTLSLNLSSSSTYDLGSSTGLIDLQNGKFRSAVAKNGGAGQEISFGNGSDGAFTNGPTQSGISVSGTTITIDTDVKATFQFTRFQLDSGYTIQVNGSQPLVIRVLGAVTVAGTFSLNGNSGSSTG